MDLDDLQRRASEGALTPDEVALVTRHLHPHQPLAAREAAIGIARAYLATASGVASEPLLLFELIRISEDDDEPESLRTAAVRALASATGYHGKPMSLDLG